MVLQVHRRYLVKLSLTMLVIFMPACGFCAEAHQRAKRDTFDEEAYLLVMDQKIRDHSISAREQKALDAALKEKKDQWGKLKYTVLISRNIRINKNDPIKCMEIAGCTLVEPSKIKEWKKREVEAERAAAEKWRSDCAEARSERRDLPRKPSGIASPFPAFLEWKIDGNNLECALEVARSHGDLNDYQIALSMLDSVGKQAAGDGVVLSAECAGDLMVKMQSYQKAVSFYQFALEVLSSLISPGEGQTQRQIAVETRIAASLKEAQGLLEIEQFGAGYVLYRKAEQKRRGENAFAEALLCYRDLMKECPSTVYSEAATAYSVDCLFALSDEHDGSCLKTAVLRTQSSIRGLKEDIRKMRHAEIAPEVIKDSEVELAETEAQLKRLKALPVGDKAAREAKATAADFIAENQFGLYRGETMLRLADYYLEREFSEKDALAWYQKACGWFENVDQTEAKLAAFDVPTAVKSVSAPPPSMKNKDDWGNMKWSGIGVGDLFNQRTCSWYVPYHLMMAKTKRSLCHFINGDSLKALEGIDIVLQVDEAERALYQAGWPNSYSRFKCEFEQGRMFATQEELKEFRGKARTALMVAEYYFELEQWPEAKTRYERINRDMRNRLNFSACAYLDFMLGNCALMTGNKNAALEQFRKFEDLYEKTPTWPRAMFNIYRIYQYMPDKKYESLTYLRQINKRMPDTEIGKKAYYHEAEFWFADGKPERAKPIFLDCQKKYNGTWLARGAGQYLDEIESIQRDKTEERAKDDVEI